MIIARPKEELKPRIAAIRLDFRRRYRDLDSLRQVVRRTIRPVRRVQKTNAVR